MNPFVAPSESVRSPPPVSGAEPALSGRMG